MNSNEMYGINDLVKKIMDVRNMQEPISKNIKELSEIVDIKNDEKNKYIKALTLDDLFEIINSHNSVDKSENTSNKTNRANIKRTNPYFKEKGHTNIYIDSFEPDKYDKKAIDFQKVKKSSSIESTNILNEVIDKIIYGTLTISDLNKETLESLVNSDSLTTGLLNDLCEVCNIDKSVFDYLCKILRVEKKKPFISHPVSVKYVNKEDDFVYFINSFELLIGTNFTDKELWNKLSLNLISESTKQLELKGVLGGTSETQVAIPFIKCVECEKSDNYKQEYGFAIFNIPLDLFIENIDKILLSYDQYIPVISIQK